VISELVVIMDDAKFEPYIISVPASQ